MTAKTRAMLTTRHFHPRVPQRRRSVMVGQQLKEEEEEKEEGGLRKGTAGVQEKRTRRIRCRKRRREAARLWNPASESGA